MPLRWSVTAHRTYRECPRMAWLLRTPGVERDTDPSNNRGIVLHAGLAAGYDQLAACRDRPMTPGAVRRRVADVVDAAVTAAAVGMTDFDADEAYTTVLAALEWLGPLSRDHVLGVEHEMVIVVDGVEVVFRADVIYRRDGIVTVRDWKSSSTVPRRHELFDDRQLSVGALCAARTFDVVDVDVEIASIGAAVAVSARLNKTAALAAAYAVADSAREFAQDREFEPTPGEVCATCPVRRYCPVYAPKDSTWIPTPDGRGGVTSPMRLTGGAK